MRQWKHGDIHWTELMTSDAEGAKAFFKTVVGWTYVENPMGPEMPYTVVMQGETPVCGIFQMTEEQEGEPSSWVSYVAVDDVDATVAKVAEAGGGVLREPFDVPNVGRIAMIADPMGAVIGIMTPSQPSDG